MLLANQEIGPKNMTNSVTFSPALNDRQFYSRETLSSLSEVSFGLVSIRTDFFDAPKDHGWHVDLILKDDASDGLVYVVALPILINDSEAAIVWPEMFSVWRPDLVEAISTTTLKQLQSHAGQRDVFIELQPIKEIFGQDIAALTDGRTCPCLQRSWSVAQVVKRYRFVAPLIRGRVLECATGPGLGASYVLANNAAITRYLSADLDPTAVRMARNANWDARFEVRQSDFNQFEGQFDTIVSLETIEHTPNPHEFVDQLIAKLAPGGEMIVSIPCERWHGTHLNPNHWTNWNYRRLARFFRARFENCEFFYYNRPHFGENPFDIGDIFPLAETIDVAEHEGYVIRLSAPIPVSPQKTLVVRRRFARGDVLETTAVVSALRQQYPDHELVVWTDVVEVFADNPHVDLLVAVRSGYRPHASDLLIDLDAAYERTPKRHMLESYAAVAKVPLPNAKPVLHLTQLDYQQACARLDGESWQNVARVVAFHMGATPDRSWPHQHWTMLGEFLLMNPDVGILVVGAGRDGMLPNHPRVVNLNNTLDLRSSAAAVAVADLLVGPDSTMLHVAAAVGTEAIGLYGMVNPATRIPPGAVQHAIVSSAECAGCLHELPAPNQDPRCKFGKAFCMDLITPAEVFLVAHAALRSKTGFSWRTRATLGGARIRVADQFRKSPPFPGTPTDPTRDWLIQHSATAPETGARRLAPHLPPAAPLRPHSWLDFPLLPADRSALERRCASELADQCIQLLMIVPPALEDAAIRTIRALERQVFGAWKLTVVSVESASASRFEIQEHRISVRVLDDEDDTLELTNEIFSSSDADWVATIYPGDTLAEDAFAVLLLDAGRRPDTAIAFGDDEMAPPAAMPAGVPARIFRKPFGARDLFQINYVGDFFLCRRNVFRELGGFDPAYEGMEHHDLLLRCLIQEGENAFAHVERLLYKPAPEGRLQLLGAESLPAKRLQLVNDRLNQSLPGYSAAPIAGQPLLTIRMQET